MSTSDTVRHLEVRQMLGRGTVTLSALGNTPAHMVKKWHEGDTTMADLVYFYPLSGEGEILGINLPQ